MAKTKNQQSNNIVIDALKHTQSLAEIQELCKTLDVKTIQADDKDERNPIDFFADMYVNNVLEEGEITYTPRQTAQLVELFLSYGVEVKPKTLFDLVWHGKTPDVVEKMITAGIDINMQNDISESAIDFIFFNDACPEDMCQVLLDAGANLNKYDRRGNTPLHNFLYDNHQKNDFEGRIYIKLTKMFLKYGANPLIINDSGENGNDIMKFLTKYASKNTKYIKDLAEIVAKASENLKKPKQQKTLIDMITENNSVEDIKNSIKNNVVNITEQRDGLSALWFATSFCPFFDRDDRKEPVEHYKRTREIILFLLEKGLDPNIPNKNKESFLDICLAQRIDKEIIEKVLQYISPTKESFKLLSDNEHSDTKTKNKIKKLLNNAMLEKTISNTYATADPVFSI